MAILAPAPLKPGHEVDDFASTHPELTDWLRRRARDNEEDRGSRCLVACEGRHVIGYYALAAGSIERAQVPGRIRRNMPDPIPAIVLGRLAVDTSWRGQGLGADLLQDAVLRALQASREIGARVLLCHAIDASARAFYLHHGFVESTFDPMIVMLDLKKVEAVLVEASDNGELSRSEARSPAVRGLLLSTSVDRAPTYASASSLYASTGMQAHMMFLSP